MSAAVVWMSEARCRDEPAEVFFPTDGSGVEVARRICAACPVRERCLDYAITHRIEHGIWGGASERARRRMARDRSRRAGSEAVACEPGEP
jgi:WhiB family redox-sensing transcriptional regulator